MRQIIQSPRINEFAVIFIAYLIAFAVVDFVVEPVQRYFVSSSTIVSSLLFIPHGIRVIAAWLCGVRAILPLILAEFLGSMWLWQPDVGTSVLLGSSIVGGLCVYLTFEVFRFTGIELQSGGKHSGLTNWKSLILLAGIASIFNSIGKQVCFENLAPLADEILIVSMFWLGDTLGTLACLLLLIGVRRRFRF